MLRKVACHYDPWAVACGLLSNRREGVFLDGAASLAGGGKCAGWGGWSILAVDPLRLIAGQDWRLIEEALAGKGCNADSGEPDARCNLPPEGALIGSVDYDGRFCFGVFEDLLAYDHARDQWWCAGRADKWLQGLTDDPAPESLSSRVDFRVETGREAFEAMIIRAQEYIADGDIYQVNLSRRFVADGLSGDFDLLALYARLRQTSPAPYAAFLRLGERAVASSSPELFLKMNGQSIQTRPIKGTRPRGRNPDQDAELRAELEASSKERAELIMITDLERNDLGQVCTYGSVHVTQMLAVESFAQVHHMVSTVEGELRAGVSHAAALAACLPGGSISGAPKRRACQIIAELEPTARGLYTGALGYLGFQAASQFSIVIRTLIQEGDQLHFHSGAGIVADSVPGAEFDETSAKAAGLLAATRALSSCSCLSS